MKWLRTGASARKLRRVVFWTCVVSILLALELFSLLDFVHRRQQASQEARLLSDLTASRIEIALSGNDVPAAIRIVRQLGGEQRVIAACLFGPHGHILADYVRAGPHRPFTAPPIRPAGNYRSDSMVTSYRSIRPDAFTDTGRSISPGSNRSGGETLGTLYMQFDAGGFFETWQPLARFFVLLLVLILAGIVLFSRRIQRAIADPIFDLTQMALRVASEKRYRDLVGQVPDPVFIIDRQSYRFLYANETAIRVYGYSFEELRQMTPLDLHCPDDRCSARLDHDDDNPVSRFNAVHMTRGGRQMDVEILSSAIVYEARPAWLTIARDVTTRNQVQVELERAKSAAEEASQAKSAFLANMSHEIRTPMNGILGMIDLALETPLTGEQREYLTLAKSSADSLLSLLNDILDFSKIEAGKLEFEEIPFTVREDLGEKIKSLARLASRKGIELIWRVRPDVPGQVVGDPTRLRQILFNLVGNAIKFTGKGDVLVNIWPESASPDGILLHFLVRDTGIGIPAFQQERIFEAFTQADGSTTRKFGGTGLGLAVVRHLIERMNGRIWVESEVGRGSSFHFTLPLRTPAADFAPPQAIELAALEGLRVLVADDNPETRDVLTEMLRHWRMESEEAESAAAALEALRRAQAASQPFHLAIIDAQMPGGNGVQLTKQLGESGDFDCARVILLRSFDGPEKKDNIGSIAVGALLSKPVQQSELLDAILKVSTGGADPASQHPEPEVDLANMPPAAEGKRVLLAEDNAVNQRLAERLLEKQGYRVVTANDGSKALDLFSRQSFELILMDVQMPGVDGLETTRLIREKERPTGAHVPIVILTAHAMKGDRERCLAAGADDYLAKPIVPHQLAAVLARLLLPIVTPENRSSDLALEPRQPFDSEALLERLEGDRALLAEMVRLFDEEAPTLVDQARAAVDQADFAALQRVAHTLKGAIGNFAAGPAFHTAEELEMAARHQASTAANSLRLLEDQLRQLTEGLEPFRSGILK